jgi:carbon storage regulator CsrA
MLVLSRKGEQKIPIGDNITITVLKVSGSVVRLGIQAPQGVRILRAELVDNPPQAGESAAEPASGARLRTQSQAPSSATRRLRLATEETSRPDERPPAGESRAAIQLARHVTPPSDSPRCRVPRAGFNSPGRHPLRVGPASVADGTAPRAWDEG